MTSHYWGKVIGGALGLATLGPLGGLLGLVVGHQFDKGLEDRERAGSGFSRAGSASVRQAFFRTTFSVMGHLAKADGRVSEEEIRAARAVMYQMQLTPELTREAMQLFNEGKQAAFPIDTVLLRFRQDARNRHDLFRTFLLIQLQAALASGHIHHAERDLLWKICQALGISRVELAQLEAMVRAQTIFGGGSGGQQGQRPIPAGQSVAEAYKILGVESTATDIEVKKAYRRLMNQHHPDKLLARGLPESMRGVAEQRTREIRAAYDAVRNARGIK